MNRSYVSELEWAVEQARCKFHDRNPNREAQVSAALDYGIAVCIARRGKEPIPPRPDIERCM